MFGTLKVKVSMEGAWTVSGCRTFQSFTILGKKENCLVCVAGILLVSLSVSSSTPCGLMFEFRALDQ